MSMKWLTILQFIKVAALYFGVTVVLPIPILRGKVQEERPCVKLMVYLLAGNFFIINLVFALQLLHISNRVTLILFTLVLFVYALFKANHVDAKEYVLQTIQNLKRFFVGTMGIKLLLSNIFQDTGKSLSRRIREMRYDARKNILDSICVVLTVGLVLWQYGTNLIENYGYCVSDIPVHNYWINAMCENHIFVAGVYPHGFHCIIYYMHEVFGVETFVLLRVFCLVQTLMIHLVLLAFLKIFCRTKYMAYGAFVIYTFGDFWYKTILMRYFASLPQEFGMVFILPAASFLLLFFKARKREVWQKQKGLHVASTLYLACFGMAFSLTLAIHFYNTIILGLFCIAIAAGHLGLVFRREYLGRIMAAGILSILIAVLPMGIAYAAGTPMEGSMRWGMSVVRSSTGQTDSEEMNAQGGVSSSGTGVSGGASGTGGAGLQDGDSSGASARPPIKTVLEQKWSRAQGFFKMLYFMVSIWMLPKMSAAEVILCLLAAPVLLLLGLVCLVSRHSRDYACVLLSAAFFIFFLYVVLMSSWFRIPALMGADRCAIYLAYVLVIVLVFCADAAVSLLLGRGSDKRLINGISLGMTAALAAFIAVSGKGRTPTIMEALETNGSITALTSILQEEKAQNFTICSANDEMHMMEEYGFHYELISLLQEMEGDKVDEYLTIPTPRVYFFIEKIPIDYYQIYEGSGRTISEEGARRMLPYETGFAAYKGENRFTVMSRMYFWAEAFRKLYPNEMRVYYESDEFVCYVLEQNVYRLFDLSIDYGYNTMYNTM